VRSAAAGVSGGTGFAGIVLLLPDGLAKSVLLILAPTITVVITSFWHIVTDEVGSTIIDWRIRRQRKRAEKLFRDLRNDPSVSDATRADAQKTLEALTALEVQLAKKRVEAIIPA